MIGVCIVTYNQADFIGEAIDSVLSQHDCGENVRIYIGDDCSSDGTENVCRKYEQENRGKIVYFRRERNLGLVGNTIDLLSRMYQDGCHFIAMLDGDDYWCDNKKLIQQIKVFKQYPNCGLVHTCVDVLKGNAIIPDKRKKFHIKNVFNEFSSYSIGNCSVIFKSQLLDHINFNDFCTSGFMSCDYVMYAIFSKYTDFAFLPEHTAIWRRGHESVSFSECTEKRLKYIQNDINQWKYLAYKFPERCSYTDIEGQKYYHQKAFKILVHSGNLMATISESKHLDSRCPMRIKLMKIFVHIPIVNKLFIILLKR